MCVYIYGYTHIPKYIFVYAETHFFFYIDLYITDPWQVLEALQLSVYVCACMSVCVYVESLDSVTPSMLWWPICTPDFICLVASAIIGVN